MKKLFFLTGEKSGDMHASKLFLEMKTLYPELEAKGLGGPHLQESGVETIADMTTLSTVGLIEPLFNIPRLLILFFKIRKFLKAYKPDLVIAVDNQGFNMPIMKYAKKIGLPTAYYIAPQEWHWGTENGGVEVVKTVDHLITVIKQEHDFYKRLGATPVYVGHPLMDTTFESRDKATFYNDYQLDPSTQILSVFPGSRLQEIKRVSPRLIGAAAMLQRRFPTLKIAISISDSRYEKLIRKQAKKAGIYKPLWYKEKSNDLIKHAYFSITSSGSITMEHVLLGTPCIVAYALNPITFYLGKKIILKRLGTLPFMSLPNLLENRLVLPEFLQENASPEVIAQAVTAYFKSQEKYDAYRNSLLDLSERLRAEKGAVAKAAEYLVSVLNATKNRINQRIKKDEHV